MRIVIDMQGVQTESRFRGIGRCTMSLAQAIVRNRGNHEIFIVLNGLFPETIDPIRNIFDEVLPKNNIRVWHAVGPVRESEPHNEWRRTVAELIREAFLVSLQPDVVLQVSLFEGYLDDAVTSIGEFTSNLHTVVVLHDLIPLLNPETYLKPVPMYEKFYLNKVECLKKADAWLAISGHAANEGCGVLGLDPALVTIISNACDPVFQKITINQLEKEQLLKSFGFTRPFLLYSGGADERKNLPRLIEAYAKLSQELRENHQLVFAGKIPEGNIQQLKSKARSVGLRETDLYFTGYVSDEELLQLYNLCKLFVFPSWHEGFGLPVLEAMACGAAVIGANTSSLPEVIGFKDALFDPFDADEICSKISQVLENESFRCELVAHGLVQAKRFSWDESAKLAIKSFESVDSSKSREWPLNYDELLLKNLVQRISENLPPDITDSNLLAIAQAASCIHTENSPKRLFVDISELVQRDAGTGVQRVTRNILKELLKNPPEGYVVEPVYATSDRIGYLHANNFIAQFCGVSCDLEDTIIDYRAGDIFFGLDLQAHVVTFQKLYLKSIWRDGVKVIFLVHDLLPISLPDYFDPGTDLIHSQWLLTLAEFDGVICVSKTVADEVKEWISKNAPSRISRFKIDWSHNGADFEESVSSKGLPDEANCILHELAHFPSFLSVGTIEPRKGQTQILEAFELLWGQGLQVNLVLVGKRGWMVDSLIEKIMTHPELGKRLFWLAGISDEYLEKIYAACACLIAASLGEGFGLPLIEAAQHKLPILARDIPVFREVAGDHACYFRGNNPSALAEAISEWLQMFQLGTYPRSDKMPWLTWRESAEHLKKQIIDVSPSKNLLRVNAPL